MLEYRYTYVCLFVYYCKLVGLSLPVNLVAFKNYY